MAPVAADPMSVVSFLGTRMSFLAAVIVVLAVTLLLLVWMAISVHVRARQLRRLGGGVAVSTPYGSLVGRSLSDPRDEVTPAPPAPDLIIFLSTGCSASERVLRELSSPERLDGIALAWTDLEGTPAEDRRAPTGVAVLSDGPTIAARLGIRVTPFAVFVGPHGVVEAATPIGGAGQLINRAGGRTGRSVERLAPTG